MMRRLISRGVAGFVVIAAVALGMSGCSSGKKLAAAEQAVTEFHTQLEQEQFDAIYDGADSAFRDAGTRDNMIRFLSKVHRGLGKIGNAERKTYFVNFNTSGTFVSLTYETSFQADPKVHEEFTYRVGDTAKLIKYHVNSDVLMKQMTE